MSLRKLVYENLAIGAMAQRIGECRYAGWYRNIVYQRLTQQTPLENRYRDSIFEVGDKVLAIEFKAPSCKGLAGRTILSYDKVDLRKLANVAKTLGKENVFLGLIHALLGQKNVDCSKANGDYMWLATPGTTAFVNYMQLKNYSGVVSIKITVKLEGFAKYEYVNTPIPTCAQQTIPLIKRLPHCASCGGLFGRNGQIRILTLRNTRIDNLSTFLESYTLASLLYLFSKCHVGYVITEKNKEKVAKTIYQFLRERNASLLVGTIGTIGVEEKVIKWPVKTMFLVPGGLIEE